MCRSILLSAKANVEQVSPQTVVKSRRVVATKGLAVVAPWVVLKSQQYQGRFFFYNTQTKASEWTLDSSLMLPTDQSPHVEKLNTKKSVNAFVTIPEVVIKSAGSSSPSNSTDSVVDSSLEDSDSADLDHEVESVCKSIQDDMVVSAQQHSGQAAEASMNTFTVLDGLGQGGYATVVKVKHDQTGNQFAMKVVSKSKVNEKNRNVLEFELQVMTQIDPSPFLQRCHVAFENSFNLYFILDLHAGGDLFHHLMKRCASGEHPGLEEDEIRFILSEVYLALEHLHKYNIIHRDIKIENVMLDASGHVKLIDYGLSRQISSPVEVMAPAGSLIYMAPELIASHEGGRHTDWWAFGVMTFELLTGRTPWSSLTNPVVIKREIQSTNVAQYLADFSPVASEFICSLMRRDFMDRLGTTCDMEITKAPFFRTVNWEATRRLEAQPVLVPNQVSTTVEAREAALRSYYQLRDDRSHANTWTMGLEHADLFL